MVRRSAVDVTHDGQELLWLHDPCIASVRESFVLQRYEAHLAANNGLLPLSDLARILEWSLAVRTSVVAALAPQLAGHTMWQEPEVRKPNQYSREHVLRLRQAAMISALVSADP